MKSYFSLSVLLTISLVVNFSCSFGGGDQETPPNTFIFGRFYGECSGEKCVEIYKVERFELFEDIRDNYPTPGPYNGNYIPLAQDKYQQVEDLANLIPTELLNEKKIVIGQPDAGDWGGFYVEYTVNGLRRFWLIDKKESNIPQYLHPFVNALDEKINLLSN